ncbi:MAG: FMN-binding negative transcriptional regulator, partial [Bryobacterales bacterium]
NPQWRDLESGAEALVIFHGPHAYISPSWYPSTREHGRMVPTWNYEVVHVYGRARCIHEPQELLPLLRALTEQHERGRPQPWSVDDAPPDFIEATARAVVGFEIPIERIEGKAKMSQNRSEADREGAREGLRQGGAAERAVAERIFD